jgi:hypothetical protein
MDSSTHEVLENPMDLLSNVTRGKIRKAALVLIYGPDGVGKSTFGANAPSPIFLGTEDGSGNLDVARFPSPKTFNDVLASIDALAKGKHEFESLVIDSLDWLEPLVWKQVCEAAKVDQIEDLGYGKGYVNALKLWGEMIERLKELRTERKMNIILVAHSQMKPHADPLTNTTYDRYTLKLNDKAAALWREYVDFVLFTNFEVATTTDKTGKTRAYGEGTRYIYTERRPSFDAKNRMNLPFRMPLSWDDFKRACEVGSPEDPAKIKESIQALLKQAPAEIVPRVQEKLIQAGDDPAKLVVIKNRLLSLVAA